MPFDGSGRLDLRALLAAVEDAPPVDAVEVVARQVRATVGARRVSLLVPNFSGDAVQRLSHVSDEATTVDGSNERVDALPLTGSIYERVLLSQERMVHRTDGWWGVLLPVTERGDAIGILELELEEEPDGDTLDHLSAAAHALGYVLVASRRHTDLFERAQRDLEFSLAAEIQRRLLPSAYTLESDVFTLAGWLEPASNVGGDTFDYSLDREYLYASITDAMGHSNEAALLATLTVGSFRNSRRGLASPAQQATLANEALLQTARPDQFVTGQLLRIRVADGRLELVNAGHPPPYLVRDGNAAELPVAVDPAFGFLEGTYEPQELQLQPGDRLVLVTDGFLERQAVRIDLSEILVRTSSRHPREVVRELAGNVLRATSGKLLDDATVLCIDWHGPGERRAATAGASADRATDPSSPRPEVPVAP